MPTILNQYSNSYYDVIVVQTEEQKIIDNPKPDPNIPVMDLRRHTVSTPPPQQPQQRNYPHNPPQQTNPGGSYGRSYNKYVSSDGMSFGISINTDMDL